jgi:hypothetical protein
MSKGKEGDLRSEEEIARRRDETVKRMIATPPKTQKGTPKRPPQSSSKSKGKRGS